MEEETVEEESMTLGQLILKISECDPMLDRWAEKTNDRNSRKGGKVWPAPVDGTKAAPSSSGATPLAQVDVTEVYSPPRITTMAKKTGLNAGSAMDLRTGYDFTTQKDREREGKATDTNRKAQVACWISRVQNVFHLTEPFTMDS